MRRQFAVFVAGIGIMIVFILFFLKDYPIIRDVLTWLGEKGVKEAIWLIAAITIPLSVWLWKTGAPLSLKVKYLCSSWGKNTFNSYESWFVTIKTILLPSKPMSIDSVNLKVADRSFVSDDFASLELHSDRDFSITFNMSDLEKGKYKATINVRANGKDWFSDNFLLDVPERFRRVF